jgi:catechol 2,3-dioxygenase-like lactoylglutathione lyase family enzyme
MDVEKQSDIRAVVTTGIPFSRGAPMAKPACKVVGIDHVSIRVSNYEKSKAFYGRLFEFLGFEISDEYPSTIGWTNGKTRYWIAPAEGRKKHRIGDVGLHHYAFELRNRKDVDALQSFLEEQRVRIVDPADEYYEDYYAVFFLDPDGIKLEGMKYGEMTAKRKRKSLKKKG